VTRGEKASLGTAADILVNIGSAECPVLLVLHPFGRLVSRDADPADPANWTVVGYEILARARGGGDFFPFPLLARMTRKERIAWTLACARLSAWLAARGIVAKLNLQHCDFEDMTQQLTTVGLNWSQVHYELAEFAESPEGPDGCIGLPPAKAPPLDEGILVSLEDASLDDCGEGDDTAPRSYSRVLALVQKQMELTETGLLQKRAFHTIKIDSVPAFAAYNHSHPNSRAPQPSTEDCLAAAAQLSDFARSVWEQDPGMQIIIEASALTREELARVPSIDASNPLVAFQGCHLRAETVLVAYE
jgi:hypothetical protein